jgi:DNA-binding LytR/AlgR family response regulator
MSDKIKALIVDDEAIARQIIATYCSHLADIELIGEAQNAFKAKAVIEEKQPDLVFLDINMPVLDGMAFVRTLKNPPQIIFTTAYKEFAHEAFDLQAVDYLLKPFSLDRFMVAIDKVKEKFKAKQLPAKVTEEETEKFTFFKFDGKIHKIDFDNLLYAEAQGNNVKIVLVDSVMSPSFSLTTFEELLPKSVFVRIHRSFIVNKSKIKHIEGNRVFIRDSEIPIGANYREDFLKGLGLL